MFTINKADREGVDKLNIEIEMMLELNQESVEWRPPINRTVASKDEGVIEVVDSIEEHRKFLFQTGKIEQIRASRIKTEITAMINDRLARYVDKEIIFYG